MSPINGVPQPDRARRVGKQLPGGPIKPARTGLGCLMIALYPLISVARGARLGLSRQPCRDNGRGRQITFPSSAAIPRAAAELGADP